MKMSCCSPSSGDKEFGELMALFIVALIMFWKSFSFPFQGIMYCNEELDT